MKELKVNKNTHLGPPQSFIDKWCHQSLWDLEVRPCLTDGFSEPRLLPTKRLPNANRQQNHQPKPQGYHFGCVIFCVRDVALTESLRVLKHPDLWLVSLWLGFYVSANHIGIPHGSLTLHSATVKVSHLHFSLLSRKVADFYFFWRFFYVWIYSYYLVDLVGVLHIQIQYKMASQLAEWRWMFKKPRHRLYHKNSLFKTNPATPYSWFPCGVQWSNLADILGIFSISKTSP